MEKHKPEQGTPDKIKKSLLTNPTLMGWLTIIGLPLGLYSLYLTFAFNKEIKPVYKVLSDVVVTESRINSKIKVYYDSVEVKNVRAVTIALWNAGNEFLDKKAFSEDRPLTIKSTTPVRVLEAKTLITTRPDLKFIPIHHSVNKEDISKVEAPNLNSFLAIQIKGDEGLEANDGATFLILYTSEVKGNWYLDARIKGVPKGIQKATDPKGELNIFTAILFLSLFFLPYSAYKTIRREGVSFWKVVWLIISLAFYLLLLYSITLHAYQSATLPSLPEVLIK